MLKYLNRNISYLLDGWKVEYRKMVYWANLCTMEIYCHSRDAELAGVIDGWKVADIVDGKVVVANE